VSTSNLEKEADKSLTGELERLYTCCAPSLTKVAERVLHNRSDAEDCVHDVLLRLYQRPWLYQKRRSALHTFLAVCVQREALARRRLLARRSKIVERLAGPNQAQELDAPDFVEIDRLRRAVRALPAKQRTALVYAFYRQLSHREIATSLALPVGTVKSRLSTAIRKLNSDLRN
jgi:RNA polymerase sigma-70 factor, ECF subfamily